MNYKELVERKIELLGKQIGEIEDVLQALNNTDPKQAASLEKSIEKLDFARNLFIELKLTANREA